LVAVFDQAAGALFVGDLLHSPLQFLYPDLRCSFDLDPAQARATRQRLLARAATTNALVLPAHLGGHSAATLSTDTDTDTEFAVQQWASFPRQQPPR
jgi:glyoxylase-like metal-dependent hydrolase (beta-lactamase superfamily II)